MPDTRDIQKIMQLQSLAGIEKFSKRTVAEELERFKLIELLKSGGVRDFPFNAALADHLIANGVTISVWCKVCRWRHTKKCIYACANYITCDNDFCSYGERRADV